MSALKRRIDLLDHWELFEKMIGKKIVRGRNIHSPLRAERNPSFGLYRDRSGQTHYKDLAGDGGDLYDFIQKVERCSFTEAISRAGALAGISAGRSPKVRELIHVPNVEKLHAKVEFTRRSWRHFDLKFWEENLLVEPETAEAFGISPCETFTVETPGKDPKTFYHSEENPCYVIEIGKGAKLYRPKSQDKRYKYIGNTTREDIFGLKQLEAGHVPESDHLLICAGQKDAIVAICNLNVPAIAFNSESTVPDDKTMFKIFRLVKGKIFVLYDNDPTGKEYSKKLCDRFPLLLQGIDISQHTSLNDLSDIVAAGDLKTLVAIKKSIK